MTYTTVPFFIKLLGLSNDDRSIFIVGQKIQRKSACPCALRLFLQNILQDAGVTLLGSVPSLVKSWKAGNCAKGLDWTKLR
jgi:hypothetical protein